MENEKWHTDKGKVRMWGEESSWVVNKEGNPSRLKVREKLYIKHGCPRVILSKFLSISIYLSIYLSL